MRVDFGVKKTEAEWQATLDSFFLSATPKWFDWLQWVTVIGVIAFIADRTKDIWVITIYAISLTLLMLYMYSHFYQIEWIVFTRIKSDKVKRTISIIISSAIAWGLYMLLRHLVLIIRKTGA